MTDPPQPDGPAEARAAELLSLVATREPTPAPEFSSGVVRRARYQAAVVRPLRVLGQFVAAIGEAISGAGRELRR
jgi:hypothetical protein